MNVSFKEKRETLLRKKSNERENSASKQNQLNCQQKLKTFEKQWMLFKENLDHGQSKERLNLRKSNEITRLKESRQDFNQSLSNQSHTVVEDFLNETRKVEYQLEEMKNEINNDAKNRRKSNGTDLVTAFHKTRS